MNHLSRKSQIAFIIVNLVYNISVIVTVGRYWKPRNLQELNHSYCSIHCHENHSI